MKEKTPFSEKIEDWFLDISKYVLTAIVISSFLANLRETWMIYVVGALVASACFGVAAWISIKNKKKE